MSFLKTLWEDHRTIVAAGAVGVVSGVAWYHLSQWSHARNEKKSLPTKWEEVGTVSQLLIYPVKSAKGISVTSAEAVEEGLRKGNLIDRSFIVITEEGSMVTGRHAHLLVTMKTSFERNSLTITSLANENVTVDLEEVEKNKDVTNFRIRGDQVQGIDCGSVVAEWLSKRLFEDGTRVRLIYCGSKKWKRPGRSFPYFTFPTLKGHDTTLYNDCSSFMVMTESSLQDLNERIQSPVSFGFYRPPIIVKGTRALDEDSWEYIKIGENVVLRMAKPCERCILTTVDPDSGKIRKDHFTELLKYRTVKHPPELAKTWKDRPIFGLHCGIEIVGKMKVGDKVYVSRANPPYWHT